MTPIIYLHGFASGPASNKARYFAARFATLGIEIRIPDLAAGDFENLTLTRQLRVIENLADGSPVSLIGSSMGGYLAALYAARHPEVERLVLLAPAFDFARGWAGYLGAAQIEQWRQTGEMEVFHYAENRPSKLRYTLMEDAARYEPFPDFRQPAIIFHGAHDDVVPAALSAEFTAAHPNARVEILDSGHELLDVLDYLGDRVPEFLGAAPPRG